MRKMFVLAFSVLILLTGCSKPDIRLQGFVKTSSGAPIQEVAVVIQKSKKIWETKTDRTGFYMFENLSGGTWTIVLSKDTYETVTQTFTMSFGSGGNLYHKNFELKISSMH